MLDFLISSISCSESKHLVTVVNRIYSNVLTIVHVAARVKSSCVKGSDAELLLQSQKR